MGLTFLATSFAIAGAIGAIYPTHPSSIEQGTSETIDIQYCAFHSDVASDECPSPQVETAVASADAYFDVSVTRFSIRAAIFRR